MFISMLATTALLGLSGSLHCALMCGSLAGLACRGSRFGISYYLARLFSYMFLGFISGFITSTLIRPQYEIATKYLSIAFGLLMLVVSLAELYLLYTRRHGLHALKTKTPSQRSLLVESILRYSPFSEPVTLGALTALLPCGFLYLAVVQAALFADPFHSAAAMAVFAVTTSPALLLTTVAARLVAKVPHPSRRFFVPTLTLICAGVVLWRGFYASASADMSQHALEHQKNPTHQPRCH